MRITRYQDLMAQYENPISHACDMEEGQVFIANGWERPEGFCQSAGNAFRGNDPGANADDPS